MAILTIIKIIGTVLLAILAAVLIILLMVLFIPVRYSIKGRIKEDSKCARAEAGWFFNLVKVTASYDVSGEMSVYISVLGHKVMDIVPR